MAETQDEDINWEEVLADLPVSVAAVEGAPPVETPAPAPAPVQAVGEDEDSSAADFMATMGVQTQDQMDRNTRALYKPWMQFHKFVLVKTVEEVRNLVDAALLHGRCALDTETQGLDNRIEYDPDGKVYTRHKIVGYCIGLKGVGYYIPIRHHYEQHLNQRNPNVPVDGVDAEIRRLCLESQPVLTEEGRAEDPYASTKWEVPPRVILYMWNAKFDQEMLYPVTGIDFWHPESFEDGMLAAYTYYTDDILGLKEKAAEKLSITAPGPDGKPVTYRYEMIKLEELFPTNMPKSQRKFGDLYPEEDAPAVWYGCSDGICTELICEAKRVKWDFAKEPISYDYKEVVSEVAKNMDFTYRLEKQTAQAVRTMERCRAKIDKGALQDLLVEAQAEEKVFDQRIQKLAKSKGFENFNPGSPEQLSEFLFEKQGLDINPKPKRNEASGHYKTDAATLEQMQESHPDVEVLDWIVKYRQIGKIIGTYLTSLVNNCDENQCLRFNFKQTGAATGRFTAPAGEPDQGFSGIPIQGIPARNDPKKPKVAHSLRRMFIAREGYTLVKIDYAGQELRIVTNLSREPLWLNEFRSAAAQGKEADLHTLTAQAFFGQHITKDHKLERNMGKIANFSLIYGGGTQAIQRATKCDKMEAGRRKSNFDKSVPVFAKWVAGQHASVKKNLGVKTAFKRFIRIPDANVKPGDVVNGVVLDEGESRRIRAGCERKSTNYPIQGSGADILKISLVKLVKELGKKKWLKNGGDDSVRLIMTVHDEIVFEVKHERLMEAVPLLIQVMESPSKLCRWEIPLVVEPLIGLNWEAKYDWLKIMKGEAPVPDWLVGHVRPGESVKVDLPAPVPRSSQPAPQQEAPKPRAEPTLAEAPKAEVQAPPPSSKNGKKLALTAVFVIPKEYLTEDSVRAVMVAISGSIPIGKARSAMMRLKVLDQGSNLLIGTHLNIHVDPELFSGELKRCNLGGNNWAIEEDAP